MCVPAAETGRCHPPRYQTYSGGDYRSNECMRQNFEPLYYQYGVDLQFHGAPLPLLPCSSRERAHFLQQRLGTRPSTDALPLLFPAGHVHAYERSYPVYNYVNDPCGTTHILIGDGGKSGGVRLIPRRHQLCLDQAKPLIK